MRGSVPRLPSAHPIESDLPAVYVEDGFTRRFVAGLDEVLAPVFLSLDCLDSYLDPWLTPRDFLPWLASWVGIEMDETWPEKRARKIIANAVRLQQQRGTLRGLTAYLRMLTGGEVEVAESGGASFSTTPGSRPPGRPQPGLAVVIRVADPSTVDRSAVHRAIRDHCPAHLPFEFQVLRGVPAQ